VWKCDLHGVSEPHGRVVVDDDVRSRRAHGAA
jgi:hypothetical protein